MELEILENDFASFQSVPAQVYPKDFKLIPFSDERMRRVLSLENPQFQIENDFRYWTAIEGAQPVGRIMAHIPRAENWKSGVAKAYFGWLDCTNDRHVLRALLERAEAFARENGCRYLVGNHNAVANQLTGVLVRDLAGRHCHGQIYSPEYIAGMLAQEGYLPVGVPSHTYEVNLSGLNPEILLEPKQRELLQSGDFKTVAIGDRPLAEFLDTVRDLTNSAYGAEPGYVPRSSRDIQFHAEMLVPDLSQRHPSVLVEYKGRPVGFWLSVPSGVAHTALFLLLAVDRDYQKLGISRLLLYGGCLQMQKEGYSSFCASRTVSFAKSAGILDAAVMHELRFFQKEL